MERKSVLHYTLDLCGSIKIIFRQSGITQDAETITMDEIFFEKRFCLEMYVYECFCVFSHIHIKIYCCVTITGLLHDCLNYILVCMRLVDCIEVLKGHKISTILCFKSLEVY